MTMKNLLSFGADENLTNKDGKKAKDYYVSGSFNNAMRKLNDNADLYQAIIIACLNKDPNLRDAL